MARDVYTHNETDPVNFTTEKIGGVERPVPDEPHIRSKVDTEPKEQTVQTGFARGGTTRPPAGVSGQVEQLDNDGKPVKVHPGEIAKEVEENGPHAGLKKLGGPDSPPGDPSPESASKPSKKKDS